MGIVDRILGGASGKIKSNKQPENRERITITKAKNLAQEIAIFIEVVDLIIADIDIEPLTNLYKQVRDDFKVKEFLVMQNLAEVDKRAMSYYKKLKKKAIGQQLVGAKAELSKLLGIKV